jgi:hypothetical protein
LARRTSPRRIRPDQIDRVDARAIERKDPLDAFAVRDLAHGEGRVDAAVLFGDADAFKGLNPLASALDHLDVDPQRIAGAEGQGRALRG